MYISNTRPLPVPPLYKRAYMFTKDLEQLTEDLVAADDKPAVIQRYKDALTVKGEVRYEFWSNLGPVVLTYLEVCVEVSKAGKNGESRQRGLT